jgi:hypothetical protein
MNLCVRPPLTFAESALTPTTPPFAYQRIPASAETIPLSHYLSDPSKELKNIEYRVQIKD